VVVYVVQVWRIEKMRAKRAFEATLPPLDDLEQLPRRQRMIEEWEAEEWKEREGEIHGVQDERLNLLEQALLVGGLALGRQPLMSLFGVCERMLPVSWPAQNFISTYYWIICIACNCCALFFRHNKGNPNQCAPGDSACS